jgi:hypothetical protein
MDHLPVALVHHDFVSAVTWQCILPWAVILELTLEHNRSYVFVNTHLPDASKRERKGLSIDVILSEISLVLESRWLTCPWSQLVVAGDFNCSLERAGPFCLDHPLCEHSIAVHAFSQKWLLQQVSGCMDVPLHERYTHLHYVSKTVSIIDHVLVSGGGGANIQCSLDHAMGVRSDRSPITASFELVEGRRKKRRLFTPKFQTFESINRFQALADDLHFDNLGSAYEGLSRVIDVCRVAAAGKPKPDPLSCLEPYREHIRHAQDPIMRKRAIDRFHYETAFLDYYNQLYGDPSNNLEDQAIKLASLEQECRDTEPM